MLFNCEEVNTGKYFQLKGPFLINKDSKIEYRDEIFKILEIEKYIFNTDGILESVEVKLSSI